MDAISSTYGSRLTGTAGVLPAPRQDETPPGAAAGTAGGQSTPATPAPRHEGAQLGIQQSGSSQDEFRPYGPRGVQPKDTTTEPAAANPKELLAALPGETTQNDPQIQQQIAQLKATEEKVKAHEAAHKSGGAATGPISYSYTRGPDGKNYITGGEVPITIASGNTPQETISRMQQVIQAALAPADPSPQDRAVAAQAAAMQQTARQEQSSNGSTTTGAADTKLPTAPPTDTTNPTNTEAAPEGVSAHQTRQAYSDPAVNGSTPLPERTGQVSVHIGSAPGAGTSQQSKHINTSAADSEPSARVSLYH